MAQVRVRTAGQPVGATAPGCSCGAWSPSCGGACRQHACRWCGGKTCASAWACGSASESWRR
eukprot:1307986-Alexandrium_andersonii.AAC.1